MESHLWDEQMSDALGGQIGSAAEFAPKVQMLADSIKALLATDTDTLLP